VNVAAAILTLCSWKKMKQWLIMLKILKDSWLFFKEGG